MPRPLKVYRTPIGFHDAYVAAASQKAALAAWGSDANLFARGMAEEVTDAALTEAPLAAPGTVIRVARGSAAEHLAALPKAASKVQAERLDTAKSNKPRGRSPRPSRAKLIAADDALAAATAALDNQAKALDVQERTLAKARAALERERKTRLVKLTQARDAAQNDYRAALAAWEP